MPIVLLTDFGTSDGYVGSLKGVLASMVPEVPVIDLGHDLPPFALPHAAYVLNSAYRYFPTGSIFVTVVDPGVGGERRAVLIETERYFFLAPDNGVLAPCLEEQTIQRMVELNHAKYFLKPTSGTFHGRDVFAPIAAHLSRGVPVQNLGEPITEFCPLPIPHPRVQGKSLEGNIWTFDRFGNAITTLRRAHIEAHFLQTPWQVTFPQRELPPLHRLSTHYASGAPEDTLMLYGSGDNLEIAINCGSAQEHLKLKVGDPILLRPLNA